MKRVRTRVRELTDSRWNGVSDVRELIEMLNRFLRGWGNYFRTGNAAIQFSQVDKHVVWRLKRFLKRRKGRHLRAGEVARWTREYFEALGLHRLTGTICYPGSPLWETA
jgi:RNA-directed DNA polymerase